MSLSSGLTDHLTFLTTLWQNPPVTTIYLLNMNFLIMFESATPELKVMKWSRPLWWACHLAHSAGLTWHLTQQNEQGLDHSTVCCHRMNEFWVFSKLAGCSNYLPSSFLWYYWSYFPPIPLECPVSCSNNVQYSALFSCTGCYVKINVKKKNKNLLPLLLISNLPWLCCRELSSRGLQGGLPPAIGNLSNLDTL